MLRLFRMIPKFTKMSTIPLRNTSQRRSLRYLNSLSFSNNKNPEENGNDLDDEKKKHPTENQINEEKKTNERDLLKELFNVNKKEDPEIEQQENNKKNIEESQNQNQDEDKNLKNQDLNKMLNNKKSIKQNAQKKRRDRGRTKRQSRIRKHIRPFEMDYKLVKLSDLPMNIDKRTFYTFDYQKASSQILQNYVFNFSNSLFQFEELLKIQLDFMDLNLNDLTITEKAQYVKLRNAIIYLINNGPIDTRFVLLYSQLQYKFKIHHKKFMIETSVPYRYYHKLFGFLLDYTDFNITYKNDLKYVNTLKKTFSLKTKDDESLLTEENIKLYLEDLTITISASLDSLNPSEEIFETVNNEPIKETIKPDPSLKDIEHLLKSFESEIDQICENTIDKLEQEKGKTDTNEKLNILKAALQEIELTKKRIKDDFYVDSLGDLDTLEVLNIQFKEIFKNNANYKMLLNKINELDVKTGGSCIKDVSYMFKILLLGFIYNIGKLIIKLFWLNDRINYCD